jgi:hypothetical protein
MGFVIDEPDSLTTSWRLSKLATRVSRTTSPGTAWFAGTRLLVLAVGCPRLVNAILVTGLWAGTKVVSRFATIPAGQITGEVKAWTALIFQVLFTTWTTYESRA